MKANGICSQPMNQPTKNSPMNLPQDALAIHQVFKDSLAFLDGDDLPEVSKRRNTVPKWHRVKKPLRTVLSMVRYG